jgi:ABC-type ATPase involved in cell division
MDNRRIFQDLQLAMQMTVYKNIMVVLENIAFFQQKLTEIYDKGGVLC